MPTKWVKPNHLLTPAWQQMLTNVKKLDSNPPDNTLLLATPYPQMKKNYLLPKNLMITESLSSHILQ
jgi:hypothetical protein